FVAPEGGAAGRPPRFINRRPMPYRRGGRLVIDAEGPVRGSIRLDAGPGGSDLDDRGYLRAAVGGEGDEGDAPPPPSGGIREERPGDPGPPVRYWYDPSPGPTSTGGRG